jgi:FAD/FMN-containing dehydrogenase
MLYELFLVLRVLFYQFLEFISFNNKLNYIEELKKTIEKYNKISNNAVSRTTNDIGTLFRKNYKKNEGFSLDNLNGIIDIDVKNKTINVGGKTRFYDILNYTLKYNLMPKIVPELSSITIGGAISGISIESSSFKYGWVHDTIVDMDVLTADGNVLYCTRDNENEDLFNGIPNSYGTLGYVTRAKIQLIDAKKYVKLTNYKFEDITKAFEFIKIAVNNKDADFIDAIAYSKFNIIVVMGFLCDNPYNNNICDSCELSKYPRNGIYYKSIKKLRYDAMTIYDYFWRWDADMFWGVTDVAILKNKWFRWCFGRCILNTRVLRAMQRFFQSCQVKNNMKKEKIIQDLGVPGENIEEFYNWICDNINKYPIWICPVVPKKTNTTLWTFNENKLYFDVGVFVRKETNKEENYYNKLIEKKLLDLNGNKCFYSDTFLSKKNFNVLINEDKYQRIKKKYDINNRFGDLYNKVIDKSVHI